MSFSYYAVMQSLYTTIENKLKSQLKNNTENM